MEYEWQTIMGNTPSKSNCYRIITIFTERERNIEKQELDFGYIGRSDIQNRYVTYCPNCKIGSVYSQLEEYDKNKDY